MGEKFLSFDGLKIFKRKSDTKQTAAITKATIGKQNKLTAGAGIMIYDNNVIELTVDNNMFVVVSTLPEQPISKNFAKIHLVPNGENFDLYLWDDMLNPDQWRSLGTRPIGTILTDYYNKTEVNALFSKFKVPMTEEAFEALEASGGLEAGAYYPTYEE